MQDLKERNLQYEREIKELERVKIQLAEERRRLTEDPVYLEKVAREKLGVVKKGETIYRLEPAETSSSTKKKKKVSSTVKKK